jgi:hypothetical protein
MNVLFKIGLVIALGGVGASALLLREHEAARFSALEKRLAQLEGADPTVRVERRYLVSSPTSLAAPDEPSRAREEEQPSSDAPTLADDEAGMPPRSEEDYRAEAERDLAELEGDYSQQGAGNNAAKVTGAGIYDAFAKLDVPTARLVSAECRSRTCRVEATFGSADSYNQTFERLFLGPSPLLEHGGVRSPMPVVGDDGSQHAVMFVAVQTPDE